MNETTKTLGFAVVGVAAALIAWASRPSLPVADTADAQMKVLFPEFENPLDAASLEIVEYDETNASIRPFKVAMVDNRWSIPSHDNYPTDAKDQLSEVAASLIGLKVLEMPSDSPGDHSLYGVVAPDPKSLKAGDTGVGTRVTIRDKDDKVLLDLIVGKEVPDREGLRYVRVAGQDPVYTVAVKTDKLSTKFADWIETDLLKLNAWDIQQIQIHDYSIDEVAGRPDPRAQLTVAYNDTGEPRWQLTEDKVFRDNKWVDGKLGEDEELNTAVLDEMRNALDDLKIVDVARKPAGLSANLKATGSFYSDRETIASLASKGFYVVPIQDYYELLSNEGEVRVRMKDGVQYVLRFGEIAGTGDEGSKEGDSTDTESSGSGMNRYLFVMAEFNPEAIPKPELEPLPEEKPADKAPEAKPDDSKAEEKAEGQKADDKEGDEKAEADRKAERERIEKENKRKQEEYEQKIKEGQERVKELNARFADWYYIIADEVYQKVHLSREKVIKKKEAKDETQNGAATGDHGDPDPAEEPPPKDTPAEFETLKKSAPGKKDGEE